MPIAGAAAASDGTTAYVFGGYGNGYHAETYRYDPAANTWTQRASMVAGDGGVAAEYGRNGKFYVQGGFLDRTANRIYDVASDSWSVGAPVPDSVTPYAAHAYANGKVYLMGGADEDSGAHDIVRVYDIAANVWETVAPLPMLEYGMAAGVIGGKIYVAGGADNNGMPINSLYIYDLAGNSWSAGAALPIAVNYGGGAVVDGRLWVIGGWDQSPARRDITQVYDPVSNTWSFGPSLPEPRMDLDAITLNSNPGEQVLIVGGVGTGGLLSSVEANAVSCAGGLMVASALTIGFQPNDYGYLASNFVKYTFSHSRPAANQFAIFQTHDPWDFTVIEDAITAASKTFTVFDPSDLAAPFDFDAYRVVILNWDDHVVSDVNPFYAAAIPALEGYVRRGGVVWLQAAIQGTTGDALPVPFGGEERWALSDNDAVIDPGSPLVIGAPDQIVGANASRAYYSGAANARDVVRFGDDGPPVLFERQLLGGVVYDRDHDLKTDRTFFRPSTGVWHSALSDGGASAIEWGVASDVDVMGDYDGDAHADVAVFRPSSGAWFILESATGAVRIDWWGASGDIPMAGDVDGDGKDDLVVFRSSLGIWYVKRSSGGTSSIAWGTNSDQPMLGDFDGDGLADLVAYRPGSGVWHIALAAGGTMTVAWGGVAGDIPVVGDFDGDRKCDAAIFRPTTGLWWINESVAGPTIVGWGAPGDVPVSGDWNGDGAADVTVWRPTTGHWFTLFTNGQTQVTAWGAAGDKAIGRAPGS